MYVRNSTINSEMVLEKNKAEAYEPHYQLLKEILINEAQDTSLHSQKLSQLTKIYDELSGIKK